MYKETLIVQNKNGDSMLLLIKDKVLLLKVIAYLDELNISYTTNINDEYDYIIVAELSRKNISLIEKQNKKIIFITYLIENKIIMKNKYFLEKLNQILSKCFKVIVSLPSIKKIINQENVIVIEQGINEINLYERFKINKHKKKILIVDLEGKKYNLLDELNKLYSKYEYIYLTHNGLVKKDNYTVIKEDDEINYIELIKMSNLVIILDTNINMSYLYPIIILKKQIIMKNSSLYEDYLINSKNIYLFQNKKELLLKFKKIVEKRVANLTDEAYQLILENNFQKTINKIKNNFNKM